MDENQVQHENIAAGLVGALLFSLSGGAIYVVMYQIGVIASIAGFIGVILAIKGYGLMAKKESTLGVILSSVIALIVICAAWWVCIGIEIHAAYEQWYADGEIDFTLNYIQSIRAVPLFLTDEDIGPTLIKDLLLTVAFSLLGIVGTVINKIKNIKRQKLITEEAQYDSLNGNVKGVGASDTIVDSSLNSTPIRSAETTEKIKKILQAKAFGHEIVFRKVGKSTEELVVDNIVYAEQTVGFITKPYSMSAIINGHNITVGMFQGNYIQVDGVVLATSVRWF